MFPPAPARAETIVVYTVVVHGKTGAAPSRNPDGSVNAEQLWIWFVGWATRDERAVVFARLTLDTDLPALPAGRDAREAFLRDLFSSFGSF